MELKGMDCCETRSPQYIGNVYSLRVLLVGETGESRYADVNIVGGSTKQEVADAMREFADGIDEIESEEA